MAFKTLKIIPKRFLFNKNFAKLISRGQNNSLEVGIIWFKKWNTFISQTAYVDHTLLVIYVYKYLVIDLTRARSRKMHCLAEVTTNLCTYKSQCTTLFNTNCCLAHINLIFLLSSQSWISTA